MNRVAGLTVEVALLEKMGGEGKGTDAPRADKARQNVQAMIEEFMEDELVLNSLLSLNDRLEVLRQAPPAEASPAVVPADWEWKDEDDLPPIQVNKLPQEENQASAAVAGPAVVAPNPPGPWLDDLDLESSVSCPICDEDVQVYQALQFQQCGHIYCCTCIQQYLNTKITDKEVLDLKCPHPGCQTPVDYQLIRALLTPEMMEKYLDFSVASCLEKEEACRFCPRAGCGLAIIGDPRYKCMHCPACSTQFCFDCNETWHEGTCEQYKQWKVANGMVDQKFEEYVKAEAKKCPKCGSVTEKNEGCNHMRCIRCRHEWCWLCEGQYSPNHYAPWNLLGCPLMQSGKTEHFSTLQRVGVKAGVVVGGILALGLAVPAAAVALPVYGVSKLIKHMQK